MDGQVIIKEIIDYDPFYNFEKYKFPSVIVPGNKRISKKINRNLMVNYLQLDTTINQKSIFEKVWIKEDHSGSVMQDFSYEVKYNSRNIFSIAITYVSCGAYCEDYTSYSNYDMNTGEEIKMTDLFTPKGKVMLLASLNLRRKKLMKNKIRMAKDSLQIISISKNEGQNLYYTDMIFLYENCINENIITDYDYFDFYIRNKTLYLIPGRCAVHAIRSIDELAGSKFSFYFKNWTKYLSPYAIKLLKLHKR